MEELCPLLLSQPANLHIRTYSKDCGHCYLAVHKCSDLCVGGTLGELLANGDKREYCLPIHEEELSPVDPRRVLEDKLVSVVTIRIAAHLIITNIF